MSVKQVTINGSQKVWMARHLLPTSLSRLPDEKRGGVMGRVQRARARR